LTFSQTAEKIKGRISGVVLDTLIIYPDYNIPKKFYEVEKIESHIEAEYFTVDYQLTYPQLFYTIFSRDKGYVLNRPKSFFIDATSTAMTIDTANWEESYVNGTVGDEYEQQFKPFVEKEMLDRVTYSFYSLPFLEDEEIDTVLYNYSKRNPDSFVALWFLIKRYYQFGYSELRENHLQLFSNDIKIGRLWKLLNEDINNALLKQGKTFPPFKVLDSELNTASLKANQEKYILLDFWFTSCKPCIQALPQLNAIYKRFHKSGFVSISVDRERSVEKWRARIGEEDMPWKHYLDLNGISSNELPVKGFPRYILLDKEWKILNTDISLDDLDAFLDSNLSKG